jgi:hypothetical protein
MKKSSAFFLSLLCTASLVACAQPTPTVTPKPVEITPAVSKPKQTAAPVNNTSTTSSQDSIPMTYPNNPTNKPPISAAKLRKDILALIASLQSREDTNQVSVEKVMDVTLTEDEGSGGRFSMRGDVDEGWGYWYYVRKLEKEPGSTIEFRLFHNEQVADDALPKTCTLDFETLAKDLVGLGYKRGSEGTSFFSYGNKRAGFSKDFPQTKIGFGVGLYVYRADNGTENGRLCVETIRITNGTKT